MINIRIIVSKIQGRFNEFITGYKSFLSKPECKFLSDMVFGILKSKHIHLAKIGRSLIEKTTPKKVEERLSYHLGKEDLSGHISQSHIESVSSKLGEYRFIIYDSSDIIKESAERMEGLSRVRDGSKSDRDNSVIGNGYHWDNLVVVSEDGKKILSLLSDIYSSTLDSDYSVSENEKIISLIDSLDPCISHNNILVIDIQGDRRKIIKGLLGKDRYFIIRQTGDRYLIHNDESMSVREISKKVRLKYNYKVIRNKHGRITEHNYRVGAIEVYFPTDDLKEKIDKPLYLVVVKEKGKGYSWFLSHLPVDDLFLAVELTMKGYSYRWIIEEFHRQVKQDFSLEDIRYQRYEAIKTIGSILALVMTFISSLPENIMYSIIKVACLLPKNKISDLPKYIFYRLTEALKFILSHLVKKTDYKLSKFIFSFIT